MKEIKKFNDEFNPNNEYNLIDFKPSVLFLLESLFLGLSYYVLYLNLESNAIALGIPNICSILHESSKNLKEVLNILDNENHIFTDENSRKKFREFVFFFWNLSEITSLVRMTKFHEAMIQDNPVGGHMGLAVSFLKAACSISKNVII